MKQNAKIGGFKCRKAKFFFVFMVLWLAVFLFDKCQFNNPQCKTVCLSRILNVRLDLNQNTKKPSGEPDGFFMANFSPGGQTR
jgi:hypothetical protein